MRADCVGRSRLWPLGRRPVSERRYPYRRRHHDGADETEYKHYGKMDFVDNVINTKTGTIRGRAIFDNKDGLLTPGFGSPAPDGAAPWPSPPPARGGPPSG